MLLIDVDRNESRLREMDGFKQGLIESEGLGGTGHGSTS